VERAIAQVATFRGRRLKLRYRGVASNHAWLKRRTAALNLRNLAGKGLTRRGGAWGAGHLTGPANPARRQARRRPDTTATAAPRQPDHGTRPTARTCPQRKRVPGARKDPEKLAQFSSLLATPVPGELPGRLRAPVRYRSLLRFQHVMP
jgi:hypothetical protein